MWLCGRLQHLLSRASWDDAAVRREVAAYVAENLTAGVDDDPVTLVFDETSDAKKGTDRRGTTPVFGHLRADRELPTGGICHVGYSGRARVRRCPVSVFGRTKTAAETNLLKKLHELTAMHRVSRIRSRQASA